MKQGQNLYVLGDSYFTPLHLENLDFGCTHDHHRVECIQSRQKFAAEFQVSDVYF